MTSRVADYRPETERPAFAREDMVRRRVVVYPPEAHVTRRELFNALERAFPVRIVAGNRELVNPDAALVFECHLDEAPSGIDSVMTLRFMTRAGSVPGGAVHFADSTVIDSRLRGKTLRERKAVLAPFVPRNDETVLAATSVGPIWTRSKAQRPTSDRVSTPLDELRNGESLRDHLVAGQFVALLPLLSFLRELTSDIAWSAPPLRAAFIFDDPNLHWSSYGYVDYPQIIRSADSHGYHVAMAMVPYDGWFSHPRAVASFSDERRLLSLAVHGNAHRKRELESTQNFDAASRLLAQALRRTIGVEGRTGLHIDRVMVPPHGACSESSVRAARSAGFEAACLGRPYPWVARWGDSPYKHPAPWRPLTGFESADIVEGLPMLLRQTFHADSDDIVLRAYLNQPLLLYGHHNDVAGGLDLLEDLANRINALGDVHWMSLETISRSNVECRRDASALWVRSTTQRMKVDVPDGVTELRLIMPWWGGSGSTSPPSVLVSERCHGTVAVGVQNGVACIPVRESLTVDARRAARSLDIRVPPSNSLDIWRVPRPRANPWTLVRRLSAEARDRTSPLRSASIMSSHR